MITGGYPNTSTGGKALGASTITEFRSKYCLSYQTDGLTLWRVNPKLVSEIEDRVAPLFFNYKLSGKADVPIKTITCYAKLSDESLEKYKTLRDEQCVNSLVYDGHIKDKNNSLSPMTLSGKLSQLSNGFLYVDENLRITPEMLSQVTSNRQIKSLMNSKQKKVAIDIFDDRVKAFGKLIKKIHGIHGDDQPIAIPYYHTHELTQLKRLLPTGVADTEPDFMERWNAGEIPYLFLQYSRSSKSLNLQKSGFIMAFYSPTWKWEDDFQIVRRLARQGQTAPVVYVYRLYMRGTMDENKTKKLGERFQGHSRFQKRIVQEILHPQ